MTPTATPPTRTQFVYTDMSTFMPYAFWMDVEQNKIFSAPLASQPVDGNETVITPMFNIKNYLHRLGNLSDEQALREVLQMWKLTSTLRESGVNVIIADTPVYDLNGKTVEIKTRKARSFSGEVIPQLSKYKTVVLFSMQSHTHFDEFYESTGITIRYYGE